MAETKLRRSKQRDTIYDMLVNDHTHPTAEVIYSHVRRIIPDISLGTVYRNLNVLVENGYIRKLNIDGVVRGRAYASSVSGTFRPDCVNLSGVCFRLEVCVHSPDAHPRRSVRLWHTLSYSLV